MRWWIVALIALVFLGAWLFLRRGGSSLELPHVAPPVPALPTAARTSPSPHAVILSPRPATTSRVLLHAPWGSGPGQLGKKSEPESAPLGPMSVTVDKKGNLYVLDEVNHRVARFAPGGAPLQPIPLNGETAQDLALGRNGAVALLDRLGERNLQLMAADGKLLGEVGLVGPNLPEAGGTTGLFTDRDGDFWVEREHRQLVRVAFADGRSDSDRPTIPGRPSRDGRFFLSAQLADRVFGTVLVRALDRDGNALWEVVVPLGAPLLHVTLLDSDAAGNVYLGAHTGHENEEPPYHIVDEKLVIAGLTSSGAARGIITLPAASPAAETFRELAVGDDGTIYRMILGASGVVIETYRF